jgi:plasmid stabilization system protein ParE
VTAARFHEAARAEFHAAAEFYESKMPGLGSAFVTEVERAAEYIVARPTVGAPLVHGFRRLMIRRFPFALVYRLMDESVQIIAVAHLHRRPCYWRERSG